METIADCQKCNGKMIPGFIPDHGYGHVFVSGWREGKPRKSFWFGTKNIHEPGTPIGAFRCRDCGFMELYARREFAAD